MANTRRKTTRRPQRSNADNAARAEKLDALHTELADQVEALTSGEGWAAMLAAAARFRNYSLNNTLLIAMQLDERGMTTATRVASFKTWLALGRAVKKGEKGLAIFAPCTYRGKANTDSGGEATPAPESATSEDGPRVLRGFRIAYVFALEQTEGDEIPDVAPTLLPGQAPAGLWDELAQAITAEGYTIERGPCGDANGYTDRAARVVRVRDDVDDAQAVKTLAHELAHVLLHCIDGYDYHGCRDSAEIEAESIAYLITASHGLDSAPYTTPYVAVWAAGDVAKVKVSAARVISTARTILNRISGEAAADDEETAA